MFRSNRLRGVIAVLLVCLVPGTNALGQTCGDPGMCSDYDSCGGFEGSCGFSSGFCFGASDGGGVCVNGALLCDEVPDCQTMTDCPEGSACTDDLSCCSTRKCFPRCVPSCLPTTEFSDCQLARKSKLVMKRNEDPAKNRLNWRTASADLIPSPMPFGDPTKNEASRFCVYADGNLVVGIPVQPSATLWTAKSTTEFHYSDREAITGISKAQEKQIAADIAKFGVKGKGASLALPMPLNADAFFDHATILTVQWHTGAYGFDCWATTFRADEARKNDGTRFVSR